MKKSRAYSVYLLFQFCLYLAFSMATVLSLVYQIKVVHLNPLQLVLVGTALESACFLLEMPTGVVADLYSRKSSIVIGMFLLGLGFLLEGAIPLFAAVLLAQVVWGGGFTFITGALEAWIASEEAGVPMDTVFMRGNQFGDLGSILGVVLGTLLGNLNLQLPIVTAGAMCVAFGMVLLHIMPETNFSPALDEKNGLFRDFTNLFRQNLRFVRAAPVLLALFAITLCDGLASEGFDRLSAVHFLEDTVMPEAGPLNSVTWFGAINLIGSGLGAAVSQLLIRRAEKRGSIHRMGIAAFTSAGYVFCLVLFAIGRNFWFMLIVFLSAGLMRTVKEPVMTAWMNDHVDEKMRATVFSANGQLNSLGQIIGGPVVGLAAERFSVSWGLACTAFLMLPALFFIPFAARSGKNGSG